MYDAALGKFLILDPKTEKVFFQAPYIYASNNPIKFIDVNGEFSFSPEQLEYIKSNYPKAYAYIMQTDITKPGILQWAHNDNVTNAMITNMPEYLYNNPESSYYDTKYWITMDHQILTEDVIIDAFTPGNKPIIQVTGAPGGTSMAGGYNEGNDGTNYTTPLQINEELFKDLENASTPEEAQVAMQKLVSTVIHEYLEDFSDDNLYDALEKEEIGGIYKAQQEIFGGTQPGYNRLEKNSLDSYPSNILLSKPTVSYILR